VSRHSEPKRRTHVVGDEDARLGAERALGETVDELGRDVGVDGRELRAESGGGPQVSGEGKSRAMSGQPRHTGSSRKQMSASE
jgi:hypothetical protein